MQAEIDRELAAMDAVLRALAPLTAEQKARVIWYTSRRYNLSMLPPPAPRDTGGVCNRRYRAGAVMTPSESITKEQPLSPPNCAETVDSPLYRALTECRECGVTLPPPRCPVCDAPAMRDTLALVREMGEVTSADVSAAFDIAIAAACNRLVALCKHGVVVRLRNETVESGGVCYIYGLATPVETSHV